MSFVAANQRFGEQKWHLLGGGRPPDTAIVDIADWDRGDARGGSAVDLPAEEPPAASIWDVIRTRRSRRDFSMEPLPLAEFSTFLRYAVGGNTRTMAYGIRDFLFRRYPSGGGLQSVSVYVYIRAVEGLDEGLYKFIPGTEQVQYVVPCDVAWKVDRFCAAATWAADAAAVIALVGNVGKLKWKYGGPSYRITQLDAGVIIESMYLVATALGWNACALASFEDELVARDLQLDGSKQLVSALLVIGKPASD